MSSSNPIAHSFDRNYLLRLLNGNAEMMGVVLNHIYHNIPNCLSEIELGIAKNNSTRIITYANRAKSAFSMLREDLYAQAFQNIVFAASRGELSSVKEIFESILSPIEGRLIEFKKAA